MSYETIKGELVETVSRPPTTDNKAISAYWLTYMWLTQKLYLGKLTTENLLENYAIKRTGTQKKFDALFLDTHPYPKEELSPPELSKLAHHVEAIVALKLEAYDPLQQDTPKTF